MSNNPIETAADELKKWLDQLQKIYQFKIDEEKKAQALAKEQAKEALAAERHEEMMEELRGMREGNSKGPADGMEYDYETEVKEAREFKEQFNEMPDGDKKAEILREKGPKTREMLNEYRKQVEARPDSLGKEVLLDELDDIDQMLDYEAYAQEHGLDDPDVNDLAADDLDAGDIEVDADDLADLADDLEQAQEGLDQVGQGVQQAAGAVAGGAGGAPAIDAAAVAAPAAGAQAPQMKPFKANSVAAALEKEGYPVKRPGGPQIQAPKQNAKVAVKRR